MKAQPLIVAKNVIETSKWYCNLLGAKSGHGGEEFEQILYNNKLILQIHNEDPDIHHDSLIDKSSKAGNGVILWFETDDFYGLLNRVQSYNIKLDRGPIENPNAKQMEVWLHDPNGYRVVIASNSQYERKPI